MVKHKVTIRLRYIDNLPAGHRTGSRRTPWKWAGSCVCGWRCLSWHWRGDEDPQRGALPMSIEHLKERNNA